MAACCGAFLCFVLFVFLVCCLLLCLVESAKLCDHRVGEEGAGCLSFFSLYMGTVN